MTGYTVHTGTSEKFSNGWDRIFGAPEKAGKKSVGKKAKPATKQENAPETVSKAKKAKPKSKKK